MVGGIRLRLLFGCVKGVVMEEMMVLMEEGGRCRCPGLGKPRSMGERMSVLSQEGCNLRE